MALLSLPEYGYFTAENEPDGFYKQTKEATIKKYS
jgi:hypothetical protein